AREFNRAIPITGLVLTKLDGTSKGGIVVAIHEELHHPVRFVGVGEQPEDLQEFKPEDYANAMFPDGMLD
ncbi:MAG: signal recognition particle-docking protein FtsY, partial [Lentisphaerae bacterium]